MRDGRHLAHTDSLRGRRAGSRVGHDHLDVGLLAGLGVRLLEILHHGGLGQGNRVHHCGGKLLRLRLLELTPGVRLPMRIHVLDMRRSFGVEHDWTLSRNHPHHLLIGLRGRVGVGSHKALDGCRRQQRLPRCCRHLHKTKQSTIYNFPNDPKTQTEAN